VIESYERGLAAAPPDRDARASWRACAAVPLVAAFTLGAALILTAVAGVPLRDPSGVSEARFVSASALVAVLVGLDIVLFGGRRR
jgi:hypothetical protein